MKTKKKNPNVIEFAPITFKGLPVITDEPLVTKTLFFDHVHYANGFALKGHKPKTRHACLLQGYWCWSNLKDHPKDIIKYIWTKLN